MFSEDEPASLPPPRIVVSSQNCTLTVNFRHLFAFSLAVGSALAIGHGCMFSSLWDNSSLCSVKGIGSVLLNNSLTGEGLLYITHSLRMLTVLSAATMSLKSCFVQTCVNAGVIPDLLSAHLSCCYHARHDAPLGWSGVVCPQDTIKRQTKNVRGRRGGGGSYMVTFLSEPPQALGGQGHLQTYAYHITTTIKPLLLLTFN